MRLLQNIVFLSIGLFALGGCMTSEREEALRLELSQIKASLAVLEQSKTEQAKSLGDLKSNSDKVKSELAKQAAEGDALKHELGLAQAALEEIQMRNQTKSGSVLSPSQIREESSADQLADFESRLQKTEAQLKLLTLKGDILMARAHPRGEAKGAQNLKSKNTDQLFKIFSQMFTDQYWTKLIQTTTSLLSEAPTPDVRQLALLFRAEAYFSLKEFGLAYYDFDRLINEFPKNERVARAMLLAGDCLVELQYADLARPYYQKASETFPESAEGRAAKERLTQVGQ